MSDKNTGGPAFPNGHDVTQNVSRTYNGMTLRDYFAAKAMQGFISSGRFQGDLDCASESYVMADAMLKERAQ